jgi:hypothetical protein
MKKEILRDYSPVIIKLKFFALATTQSFTSILMVLGSRHRFVVEDPCISQVTSIVRAFMALRFGLAAQIIMVHQDTSEMSTVHSSVFTKGMPIQVFTISQSLLLYQ